MCENFGVGEVPEPTGVVGHDVGTASNVILLRDVTVAPLMEGIQTEEVRACGGSDGGAFIRPRKSDLIVGHHPQSVFANVPMLSDTVLVGDEGGQFEIRDRQRTLRVLEGDECLTNPFRNLVEPYTAFRFVCRKPNAAHPMSTCVAGTNVRRLGRYQFFAYASGACVQSVGYCPEVPSRWPYATCVV